jgi:phenylpropionate dioxygenase-like ring-hydroxylating dioxygenase large terminal subunit
VAVIVFDESPQPKIHKDKAENIARMNWICVGHPPFLDGEIFFFSFPELPTEDLLDEV